MALDDLLWMKNFLQDDIYLLEADKAIPALTPNDTEETAEITFNYLGDQNTGFLILVNYPDEVHIHAAHLKSLESILCRKNMAIDEVTLFNTAKHPQVNYPEMISYFNPQKVLIMSGGVWPEGIEKMEINTIKELNGVQVLNTHSFVEMDSEDKKRAFWNQVKNF